jgi:gliding motility-associated-like protein
LRVVNRYGETVFRARSPWSKWDGQHKGVPCETGVYFYTLTVEWRNHQRYETKTFKGEVTLIR